jgi:hypothetical protein
MEKIEISKNSVKFFIFTIILFTTLKLNGSITLSWWWVMAPFFIAGVFSFIFFVLDIFRK